MFSYLQILWYTAMVRIQGFYGIHVWRTMCVSLRSARIYC